MFDYGLYLHLDFKDTAELVLSFWLVIIIKGHLIFILSDWASPR